MLVQFVSSETGDILMYAETARMLLEILNKECTARGVITQPEMAGAAARLRQAIAEAGKPVDTSDDDDDEEARKKPPVVGLSQRAWPLLDMLERTAKAGNSAHIVWEASAAF